MARSHSMVRAAYEDWHKGLPVDTEPDAPWHKLIRSRIDLRRDIADKRILDIGCGRGGFAAWLANIERGPALVVAADFARTAVRMGREFAPPIRAAHLLWEVGDIEEIAHATGTFDTVISCETIEHVAHPAHAVRELARVLRPGGRLFLTTPNYMGPVGLYRMYLRLVGRPFTEVGQPINHANVLFRTLHWVKRAGLRVEVVDATGHYVLRRGQPPREIRWLNDPRWLMRWFGLHSLVVAAKPEEL